MATNIHLDDTVPQHLDWLPTAGRDTIPIYGRLWTLVREPHRRLEAIKHAAR
jgi:hypothetical protein